MLRSACLAHEETKISSSTFVLLAPVGNKNYFSKLFSQLQFIRGSLFDENKILLLFVKPSLYCNKSCWSNV